VELITTLTVRESGGVGGRVNSIVATLRRNTDNTTIVAATITADSIRVAYSPNGTATIPFAMHANQADVTSASTLTLVVNATDTEGNTVSTTVTIPVNAP
jgi:hypothetical protein